MKNIAYAEKNQFLIFARYLRYVFFRILVKIFKSSNKEIERIVVLNSQTDALTKYKIQILKSITELEICTNNKQLADECGLHYHSQISLPSSLILITKFNILECLKLSKYLPNTRIIDPFFWSSFEAENWIRILNEIFPKKDLENFNLLRKENFKKFLSTSPFKDSAVCFTTGPSFDHYKEYSYNNHLKVICNSIVKNDEFLEFIGGPDILVFADPVFHLGLNPYAEEFRDHVKKVLDNYPSCFIFTTFENSIALHFLMPDYKDRVVGLKVFPQYQLISEESLTIYPTANILTLLMLPLAGSFSKNVFIFGADGRNPDEKYFWKHSNLAQLTNKMESAFEFHPSFFRDRIYSDYYFTHCTQLEKHISFLEEKGKNVFTLTDSHIPALRRRVFKKTPPESL